MSRVCREVDSIGELMTHVRKKGVLRDVGIFFSRYLFRSVCFTGWNVGYAAWLRICAVPSCRMHELVVYVLGYFGQEEMRCKSRAARIVLGRSWIMVVGGVCIICCNFISFFRDRLSVAQFGSRDILPVIQA